MGIRAWIGAGLVCLAAFAGDGRGACGQERVAPLPPTGGFPGGSQPMTRWAGRVLPAEEPAPPGAGAAPTPDSSGTIGIHELENLALRNNPTLALAARRVEALRGKYLQVGLYPNPVIGYVGEEIGDEGRAGQQGMAVGQEIVTAGKLGLDRAVVSHEIARAQRDVEIQRLRVLNDVRVAAYEVLAAQRLTDLSQRLVDIGEEGRKVAEDLLRAKEVSRVDLLQARIEANSAKVLLDNAKNEQTAAWRRLATVVGMPEMAPRPIEDRLEAKRPELTWEDSLDRLQASSPELARAYAEVERARCALARECAGRVPNVDVEAGVRYNFASEDTVATVGIGVPLQLFNRNQGNIYRARSELSAAYREVRRVELSLQERLAQAYKLYANAREQVQRYDQDILPDAKDSLELVRQAYRQGEFGYLELLTAQRTYFRVNRAFVEALRDLWVSSTRIEGLLLSGGLEPVGQ